MTHYVQQRNLHRHRHPLHHHDPRGAPYRFPSAGLHHCSLLPAHLPGGFRCLGPPPDSYRNKVVYTLPFTGSWLVYNVGPTPQNSHSWDVLTQRFAYDFVQVDTSLSRHTSRGTQLSDYFCYNQPILAAAPGTVVKVQDGVRDAPFVGYGLVDFLARSFVGNHVIVRHAAGEYGFYAHLVPGRIPVAVGDTVERSQPLGRCGHSGHSSEPHLHFHLQNRPNFYFAMGVPVRFRDLQVNGQEHQDTVLTVGDVVGLVE